MDPPRAAVAIPEGTDHDAIQEPLHRVAGRRLALRQSLAVLALERRDAHGPVLQRIPDDRAEHTHVRLRQVTLALDVANQCERVLGRRTVVHTQRPASLGRQVGRQQRPRLVLGNERGKDGSRHWKGL